MDWNANSSTACFTRQQVGVGSSSPVYQYICYMHGTQQVNTLRWSIIRPETQHQISSRVEGSGWTGKEPVRSDFWFLSSPFLYQCQAELIEPVEFIVILYTVHLNFNPTAMCSIYLVYAREHWHIKPVSRLMLVVVAPVYTAMQRPGTVFFYWVTGSKFGGMRK